MKSQGQGAAPPSSQTPMGLLRDVSRSFYLTLRVLPAGIRHQIGLAYLLARTSDTIADTELVPAEQRLRSLQDFRQRILGTRDKALDFAELARCQASPAERILLERSEESIVLLAALTDDDALLVRRVLEIIISGQELDLVRFESASSGRIVALRTDEEMDDYTFRVAGCVGEFWTRICRAHLFPAAPLNMDLLLANGLRFGKGLQLVNILRDIPADLRQGRCYIPRDLLETHGLLPEDLRDPAHEARFRPGYDPLLDRAESHLRAGWTYTNTLPHWQVRLRLACAWPILIGLDTITLLRGANVLDPQRRIKVSRARVKHLIWRSILRCHFPSAWRRLVPPPQISPPAARGSPPTTSLR